MVGTSSYDARRERWIAERSILERRFILIGNWRLVLGILEAIVAWLVFGGHLLPTWALFVPPVAFIALAIWHARVIRRRTLATRAIQFYDRGLARIGDCWAGSGSTGDQFKTPNHVYADDLDLFGRGSLFELISRARTTAGESVLAKWLLQPASRAEAQGRQEAIRELSNRVDLREEVALLGEDLHAEVNLEKLTAWGALAPIRFSPVQRLLALFLSIAGPMALIAFFGQAPLWPLLVIIVCDLAYSRWSGKRVHQITSSVETPAAGLRVVGLLLQRLSEETFVSPHLQSLHARLLVDGLPASRRIGQLQRWIDMLDSSDHLLVRLVAPFVLWREQIAMAIEAWRQLNGRAISRWIGALAEIEALSSFGSLAYERPGWTFPTFVPGTKPHFEAEALQHPLLPSSRCVPNDVSLGAELRLLIVSGSNMSGKSTLLRAVGLNTVLGWAGAPVAARALSLSSLQVGASIRVNDSLQENRSRFFAEITRLRQIVDLSGHDTPGVFLLDELLSGTNSHDRRIGAAAIVSRLVASNAIGLITTHDLALAAIETELAAAASNVHFDDQMSGGEMHFDYRLRPGIVTRSNALELMRAIGLDV